jgi:hypothetical protein
MKNAFLLLTLFVGAVDATYFDAEVQGQDIDADYFCTMDTYNELYEDCIVTIAENHGVVFDRRRLAAVVSNHALCVLLILPRGTGAG